MDVKRFLSPAPPHIHLLVAPPSTAWDLKCSWQSTAGQFVAVRVLRGHKMRTAPSLFDECAAALQFPWYFGENWDALDECLGDLEWLNAHAVVLVISAVQHLLDQEEPEKARLFFELLERVAQEWAKPEKTEPQRPARAFHVVLQCPKEDEAAVKARLKGLGIRANPLHNPS